MQPKGILAYSHPQPQQPINKIALLALILGFLSFGLPIPTLLILEEFVGEPGSEWVFDIVGLLPALRIYLATGIAAVGLGIVALVQIRDGGGRGIRFAAAGMSSGALAILGNGCGLLLAGMHN